jgi:hypothetical protein
MISAKAIGFIGERPLSVDTSKFTRKMRQMETLVHDRLTAAVERWAGRLVTDMRAILAVSWPALADKVEIDWTWGEAPAGAITIGKAGRTEYDQITVTVYARARSGSGISAAWFEFGTAPRFRHVGRRAAGRRTRIVGRNAGGYTGQITANPFFFPVYRANKRRIISGLRSTLRTAIRKINAS